MLYGQHVYTIEDAKKNVTHAKQCKRLPALMRAAIATNSPPPKYTAAKGLSEPSALARSFAKALLQRDPLERPSASECLELSAMRRKSAAADKAPACDASLSATIRLVKQ